MNKAILFFALAFAFLLHAGVLFLVKDMPIDYEFLNTKPLWENQHLTTVEKDQTHSRREEIERKNEELAQIFKEIQKVPEEINTLKYDENNLKSEFFGSSTDIKDEISLNEIEQRKIEEKMSQEDFSEGILNGRNQLVADPSEKMGALWIHEKVDILFPNQEKLTEELVKATEMSQGSIETKPTENLNDLSSLQAGMDEQGSLLGTSFQNRSGLLDQGLTESSMSTMGILTLIPEEGLSAKIKQDNLPGLQSDALRGFSSNTIGSLASSDDFNLVIEYAPRIQGEGYNFKLELVPKPGIKFKRITQNYFFVIDRSFSIRQQRYSLTKQAVSKALSFLQPGDTFNILLFDDQVTSFSPKNLPWNKENVEKARTFLSQPHPGGFFASTDLYSSLDKIVPSAVVDNEVNTALLLSDGDTYLTKEKQRETIANWTRKNSGKVSLYSLASGKGNNLVLLDLLSVFNKGILTYTLKDKDIENALLKLLSMIRTPIGKEIKVSTVAKGSGAEIEILPPNSFLPNLYESTPYIVYGTINKLEDFHVFFQGKYYDKFLDIKQPVSFAKAKGTESLQLEKKLALQQAYKQYELYLSDGDIGHLNKAKNLLQAYQLPVALQ